MGTTLVPIPGNCYAGELLSSGNCHNPVLPCSHCCCCCCCHCHHYRTNVMWMVVVAATAREQMPPGWALLPSPLAVTAVPHGLHPLAHTVIHHEDFHHCTTITAVSCHYYETHRLLPCELSHSSPSLGAGLWPHCSSLCVIRLQKPGNIQLHIDWIFHSKTTIVIEVWYIKIVSETNRCYGPNGFNRYL